MKITSLRPSPGEAERVKDFVRNQGLALGLEKVGFAPAGLSSAAPRLEEWLARGYQGQMHWMLKEPARRTDQNLNLEGAATVVACALNYYQGPPETCPPEKGIVSSYARGEDYHRVLEEKLRKLAAYIEDHHRVATKVYVDTGPVLEKAYAVAAGLGWLGKHSNLLSREASSWFFLGVILLPIELPPDSPVSDHCGTCTRCIAGCPTGAIVRPYVVDSRLCISYLTIELRGAIPRRLRPLIGRRVYGCDDCQDVCPWNRFARKSDESAFLPKEPLSSMDLVTMLRLDRDAFLGATRRSAIRRAGYAGFLRNVAIALGNSGEPQAVPALGEALDHAESLVRGHAAWALGRLEAMGARAALQKRLNRETDQGVREEILWALTELEPRG